MILLTKQHNYLSGIIYNNHSLLFSHITGALILVIQKNVYIIAKPLVAAQGHSRFLGIYALINLWIMKRNEITTFIEAYENKQKILAEK